MKRFQYAVSLASAEEGGFAVSCRDLPQLVTQGEDLEKALVEAADAMDEVFAASCRAHWLCPPRATRARENM